MSLGGNGHVAVVFEEKLKMYRAPVKGRIVMTDGSSSNIIIDKVYINGSYKEFSIIRRFPGQFVLQKLE